MAAERRKKKREKGRGRSTSKRTQQSRVAAKMRRRSLCLITHVCSNINDMNQWIQEDKTLQDRFGGAIEEIPLLSYSPMSLGISIMRKP